MQPSKSPLPVAQTPCQNPAATGSACPNANEFPISTSLSSPSSLGVGVGGIPVGVLQSQLSQFTTPEDLGHWQYPQAQALAAAKQWQCAGATQALVAGPSPATDIYKPSKVTPHSAAGHTSLMRENSVPLKMASPNSTLMPESPMEMSKQMEQSGQAGMGPGLVDLQAMQVHEMLYGGYGSLNAWGDAGASWFGPMSMSRSGMHLQQASGMGMNVGQYAAAANYMLTPPFSPGSQYVPANNNNPGVGVGNGAAGNGSGNVMASSVGMGMGMGVGVGPQPFYMDYPSGAALYAAGHAYPNTAAASYFAAYQLNGAPVNLPSAAAANLGDYLSPNSATAAAHLANAANSNSAIALPALASAMSSAGMQPPMSAPTCAHPPAHKHTAPSHSGTAGGEHRRSGGNAKTRGSIAQHPHQQASPSSASSAQSFRAHYALQAVAAATQAVEEDCDPRDLEAFAERFKQRRIKLGVTQADVGKALAKLKIPGIGSLSQSTICRFESLTLSHNNMVALKPVLQLWLQHAEAEVMAREQMRVGAGAGGAEDVLVGGGGLGLGVTGAAGDRKRKRTSITDAEKRSLEAYFVVQARPTSERIAQIAERLLLRKNVVRVWFCNQRQKQKRLRFAQTAGAQPSQGVATDSTSN